MKRLLIAGFGDIARRLVTRLPGDVEYRAIGRRLGADLDVAETLVSPCQWTHRGAYRVLHLAPPPDNGQDDTRTANLLDMLSGESLPERIVYIGTSGVYGDCAGARVDESRPIAPASARAKRRAAAEARLTDWCASRGVALVILRAPGIYASDRLPLATLRAGAPVFDADDDIYTNHIHAEDLAAIALRALADRAPPGTYNASDDSEIRLGEWYDLIADRHGLPRPPRIAPGEAARRIPERRLSFMRESRRLDNRRMKEALGVRLAFPTVWDGVPRIAAAVMT